MGQTRGGSFYFLWSVLASGLFFFFFLKLGLQTNADFHFAHMFKTVLDLIACFDNSPLV